MKYEADHPIWRLVRLAIVLLALTFVLWLNAEHFDETEVRTVITMFLALIGVEGVSGALSSSRK